MEITTKWLRKNNGLNIARFWFSKNNETDCIKIIDGLMAQKKFDYANWMITRALDRDDNIRYATFGVKLVLPINENEFKNLHIMKSAINASRNFLIDYKIEHKKLAEKLSDASYNVAHDAERKSSRFISDVAYACANIADILYTSKYHAQHSYAAISNAVDAVAINSPCVIDYIKTEIIDFGKTIIKKETKK